MSVLIRNLQLSRESLHYGLLWDVNPFCGEIFLLVWSTRNSLVISLREDPILCTVAPWWDIGLMDLGRSIGEVTRELWRMKWKEVTQTTVSLNCKSQNTIFTFLTPQSYHA
jgi:hypothetical protein